MMSNNNTIFSFSVGCNTQLCGQPITVFKTGVSIVDQTQSLQDKENLIPGDPDEWLHRNDNYIKQRKRPAEMSDEQRQEINRRQCEYRARKKAESNQNSNNTETVLPTLLTPTFAGL